MRGRTGFHPCADQLMPTLDLSPGSDLHDLHGVCQNASREPRQTGLFSTLDEPSLGAEELGEQLADREEQVGRTLGEAPHVPRVPRIAI